MATTNAKLGAAHGLASALGGKLDAPHSVITARLAPIVMRENIDVAKEAGRSDILQRYKIVSRILTGRKNLRCGRWHLMGQYDARKIIDS